MIDWDSESFHPVVNLPEDYKILDLTKGPWTSGDSGFSIGKYDEFRPNVYNTDLFPTNLQDLIMIVVHLIKLQILIFLILKLV